MVRYKKEDLEKLIIEQNRSYASIGKIYGVTGAAIKKAAKHMGIPLPIRRKINTKENFSHPRVVVNTILNKTDDEAFKEIINTSNSWKSIGNKLGYKSYLSSNVKESIIKRCNRLNILIKFDKDNDIANRTKGELFLSRKNWQSARSAIRKNAQSIFFAFSTEHKCAICGYDKHIEIAHIKAVSDFDDNATVGEINAISNLIGLCPNHHWEYDNNIIDLEKILNNKT